MVVLGKSEIGFVVLVHENQVDGDDLELVHVGGEGVSVEVHEGLLGTWEGGRGPSRGSSRGSNRGEKAKL